MAQIKRMDQIKSILEIYQSNRSLKQTARQLKISKNTVKTYVRRALSFSDDMEELQKISDEELRQIIYPTEKQENQSRELTFISKVDDWLKELKRPGVTRQLLWEEYISDHRDGYQYSQFCERLKQAIDRKDLTMMLSHKPGEVMQVDFAGKKINWVDCDSGEVHSCEVLICVLPFSQMAFAIALESQKITDFIEGLNQALLYFGKIPSIILSDNLKSYVIRSDRYVPDFTQLCQQLADHYQLELNATRVAKPKDKASVENMVANIYRIVHGPLRNEVFSSLAELNVAIRQQIDEFNLKPYQKREGTRREIFEKYEAPHMRDLPSEIFEIKRITKAKVQRNYHIMLGEDKNYYSVPYQYVGKQATVIYTGKIVEVYIDNQRVALHKRLLDRNGYRCQTNTSHMPKNHQEWLKARGYNAAYFIREGEKIGPATAWALRHMLRSRIHEVQAYNSCKGVLHLLKKYPAARLENACMRCQAADKAGYNLIKNILARNLDLVDDQIQLFNLPEHGNIRGPKAYK